MSIGVVEAISFLATKAALTLTRVAAFMFLQYIHSFGSLVEPQQAVTDVISGPLSCPDVCACRPSRPLTLAVVNS